MGIQLTNDLIVTISAAGKKSIESEASTLHAWETLACVILLDEVSKLGLNRLS